MGEVKNYDIKTMSKLIGTTIAGLGLGAVPERMRRYVTLVRAINVSGMHNRLYIASAAGSATTTTSALASTAQKYSVLLPADGIDQFPNSLPDSERPLFSFAASSYVNMKTTRGNMTVFMQYYDM